MLTGNLRHIFLLATCRSVYTSILFYSILFCFIATTSELNLLPGILNAFTRIAMRNKFPESFTGVSARLETSESEVSKWRLGLRFDAITAVSANFNRARYLCLDSLGRKRTNETILFRNFLSKLSASRHPEYLVLQINRLLLLRTLFRFVPFSAFS